MSKLSKTVDGHREPLLPPFEFKSLNHEAQEARFLILHPCLGDKNDEINHVRCSFETQSVGEAKHFIAVSNSRGYRKLQEAIEIDGHILLITVALERFLRNFRNSEGPVRLWVRHLCIDQADQEEMKRYFTREYVDCMYQKAQEVVDMSRILTDLREAGTIDKVIDIRYREWTKEWNEIPEGKWSLPSVCPVRLGKKPSIDSPTDDFEYVPLDLVADEVRMLVVIGSDDPSAPVVTHIAHCPIYCEVTYQALSYTWGTEQPVVDIVLNGQKIKIRQNLANALRAVRFPKQHTAIWIDALCIDQRNLDERNRQLRRMSQIYDNAKGVICYVGEPDEYSDVALDLVNNLQEPMMRFNEKGEWDIGREAKVDPSRLPLMCAALYKFLLRPYFRRVWVLQEVAVASNPVIACGKRYDTWFYRLETATYNLQDMIRRDWTLADAMLQAIPDLKHVSEREISFVRKLFYFRHIRSGGVHPMQLLVMQPLISQNSPGYLEAAILSRDFEATDPRDKIFALWNIAQDKDGLDFKMDYSKSVQDCYCEFAMAWAEQHGSLDIIGAVESRVFGTKSEFELPSWCPDWSIPSASSCLVRKETIPKHIMSFIKDLDGALYSADGKMKQEGCKNSFFEFNGSSMSCTGIVLDRISAVFIDPSELLPKSQRGVLTQLRFECWTDWIQKYYADHNLTTYDNVKQAAIAMLHGDLISAWPHRLLNPENVDEQHEEEEYVCLPGKSRHIPLYASSYGRADARDTVDMVSRGRTPFVSENGFMGLAPHLPEYGDVKKPWLLAIIATCSVPLLLQELDDGTYKVCGTCFVQGWMEGEILASTMGVDTVEEFWEAIEGSGRLTLV